MESKGQTELLPQAAREVIDRIIAGYGPRRVILHGSFARDDYHEGSDVDLMLVKETGVRFVDRIDQVLGFSDGEVAIEPLVYTEEELEAMLKAGNAFLEKALREGIVIYEP
jgi:predicted nucleotidyltransferase